METIKRNKVLTDSDTAAMEGSTLRKKPSMVIKGGHPLGVFCADTGSCLLKYLPQVVPRKIWLPAYNALEDAATMSDNRGMASGELDDEEAMKLAIRQGGIGFHRVNKYRIQVVYEGNKVSSVNRSKPSMGGIVGFFGSGPRQPFCRVTAYAQKDFVRFKRSWPLVRAVNSVYQKEMPHNYEIQEAALAASKGQDFIITGTAFSTLTVNRNFQTACHYDRGDFKEGFGNLFVIRKGQYEGGITCFPQYDMGVDMQTGDVLLMDVHRLHGNTPIKPKEPGRCGLPL